MGSNKKYGHIHGYHSAGRYVLFSAAGCHAGSEDRIPQILQGGVFPAIDYFHGCGRDRMAVDL